MNTAPSRLLAISIVAGIALSLASLVSCSGDPSGPNVSTTMWENDGAGILEFSTNDPKFLNYSFVHADTDTNSPTEFPASVVTATVKKNSGANNYGYGVVFGWRDFENNCRALISCTGRCAIFMTVAGITTEILGWAGNAAIHTGYGVTNVIEVTYSAPSFSVRINDTPLYTFTPDATLGINGDSGFFASTSPSEDFPNTPVDVRCKMTAPISIP